MAVNAAVGQGVRSYCIFDSDFHTPRQIAARKAEAEQKGVSLHIWSKKEIENYLLVPTAIARVVANRARATSSGPSPDVIGERLFELAGDLQNSVFDGFAQEFLADNRGGGSAQANSLTRESMYPRWNMPEARLSIVSGKLVLSKLSEWLQKDFGVSISPVAVARTMKRGEISAEIVNILTSIENGDPF